MTVTIKKTDSAADINRKLKKVLANGSKARAKTFDAYKYLGKMKGVFGDALTYQKRIREEWEG